MKVREESLWGIGRKKKKYPSLNRNIEVDVAIVGGGLNGILTAYLLSKTKTRVAVFEKGEVGSDATLLTTAFITQLLDTDNAELTELFGAKRAKQFIQSHGDAIDLIESIVKKEKIECSFMRCPAYVYVNNEKESTSLQKEYDASKKLSLTVNIDKNKVLSFENGGVLKYNNQAKFHPLQFLDRLTEIVAKRGIQIYENTEITELTDKKRITLKTKNDQTIQTKYAVVATHVPFNKPKELFAKKGVYTSYIIEAEIPKNLFKEAIYWDMDNPYHYFRVDKGKKFDSIILGGADHREEIKMDSEKNYAELEEYLQKLVPKKSYKLVRRWNGPIVEPLDGVAYIGKISPHQLSIVGHSGNGMTYSAVGAKIFADIINGKKNPYPAYNPKRIPNLKQLATKGKDYTEEFFGGAVKNIITQ